MNKPIEQKCSHTCHHVPFASWQSLSQNEGCDVCLSWHNQHRLNSTIKQAAEEIKAMKREATIPLHQTDYYNLGLEAAAKHLESLI